MSSIMRRSTDGIRWQVWAGVLGGLGALGFLAYWATRKPTSQPVEPEDKSPIEARRTRANDDWDRNDTSSYARQLARKRREQRLAAQKNTADGGSPDGVIPEESSGDQDKKAKRMGWIRGEVKALPSKKPISSFVVVYAYGSSSSGRGFRWRGLASNQTQPGFPKDAAKKTVNVSNAKGHFDIEVPAGMYYVQIQAKGFQDSTVAFAVARPVSWFRQVFGMLQNGDGSIHGVVTGQGGKPVQGAMATALIAGGSRWEWRMLSRGGMSPSSSRFAISNEAGTFVISGLPAGSYGVVVRASGHVPWYDRGIELAEGERKDIGSIQLDGSTGTIRGTVYGPDQKGKSGTRVMAIGFGKQGRTMRFAQTDSDGKYEIKDVPSGDIRLMVRTGRGFMSPSRMKEIKLKAGETQTHDFSFGVGGMTLKGRVLQADGSPLPNARVTALVRGRGWGTTTSSGESTTDEQGAYSISGLQEGLHTVTVYIERKPSPGGSIMVKGAETEYDIRLQGGELELNMVDQKTQKPLKVPVFASLNWTNPSPQNVMQRGRPGENVLFKNLPSVSMQLRVFTPGYAAYIKQGLTPEDNKRTTLAIPLEPAGRVALKLLTPDKKYPDRAFVQMWFQERYQWVPAQPSAGGEIEVSTLPPGTAKLKIVVRGFQPLEVTVDVPAEGTGQATFYLTPTPTDKKP